ncbi:MAG: hypothetical protein OEV48_20950 [Acidobacteriota bacterium]|nr:hypothetical protein [Acidobacteriota bacterium]
MSTNGENKVTVEVPAHEPEPERAITLRRALIWVAVIFFLVVLAGRLLDRPDFDSKTVPESLVGEWSSDHPEYSDRYLKMTSKSITFGIGGTSFVKYTVVGIEEEQVDGVDTIILHFRDVAGTKFKRTMVVEAAGARMYFKSQPAVIWQRDGS